MELGVAGYTTEQNDRNNKHSTTRYTTTQPKTAGVIAQRGTKVRGQEKKTRKHNTRKHTKHTIHIHTVTDKYTGTDKKCFRYTKEEERALKLRLYVFQCLSFPPSKIILADK